MTWTNDTKTSSTFDSGAGFLLQEDLLSFLLLEDGGKIILDQSYNNKESSSYTDDIKITSSYTNDSK